jgi:integrative and conjugative element protein (TIGR02256 family)
VIVWLSAPVLEELLTLADEKFPLETGGVVIGYVSEDLSQVIVRSVVGPGPEAVHSPVAFVPDGDYHQEQVAELYTASGRTDTYLGDWHSHPHGSAVLSWRDRRTLRSIQRSREARTPKPIMLVVAGDTAWDTQAWELIRPWDPRPVRRCDLRVFRS